MNKEAYKVVRREHGSLISAFSVYAATYHKNKWTEPLETGSKTAIGTVIACGPLSVFTTLPAAVRFLKRLKSPLDPLEIWLCEVKDFKRYDPDPPGTMRVGKVKLIRKLKEK